MLGTVVGTLQVVYPLILSTILAGIYYYHPNFTAEEIREIINILRVLL